MPSIFDWSQTPGSNNTTSPYGWPEGMPPAGVNDSARQMMAETAKWRDFLSGDLTTSGTDTITLTSGLSLTAYPDPFMFIAKLGGTNTGAATINVDSIGAKAVEIDGSAVGAGDLASGKYYMFVYDGTAFQLTRLSSLSISSAASNGGAAVAAGAVSVDPNNATDTAIATGDEILFADASDSNNVKKDTVQGILDLAASSVGANLIINGDFRVNQRAYASSGTLASGNYGHDRWKAGTGGGDYTFTQLNSPTQITIESGKTLIQVIEDKNVEGGNYILSWEGTAQARAGVDSATPSGSYADSPLTISSQSAGTVMSVEFDDGTLGKVKLEVGSTATDFVPDNYGTSLAKCQRYYCETGTGLSCYLSSATQNFVSDVYPVQMRAAPTITLLDTSPTIQGATASETGSASAIDFSNIDNLGAALRINGFTQTTGESGFMANGTTKVFAHAAEL